MGFILRRWTKRANTLIPVVHYFEGLEAEAVLIDTVRTSKEQRL